MHKRTIGVVALLMFALIATACGGGGSTTPATGEGGEGTGAPAEDAAAEGTVEVLATEYAFEGVPSELATGPTTFTFENVGEQVHEMVVFRIKTDATAQELLELPEKEARKQIKTVGFAFADPGAMAKKPLEAELEAGNYAMVCFVPVGTTPENKNAKGPPHFTKGMVSEFTVR
jgi:hypothetical protein